MPTASRTVSASSVWSAWSQLFATSPLIFFRAYECKHGHRAWLERYEKLQAQHAEARELEEMRRYQEEFRRKDEAEARRREDAGLSGTM
jgi:hypothetical protein